MLTAIGFASIGIETSLSHPDLALAFGNGIRPAACRWQRRSETATFRNSDAVGRQSPSETLEHIACEHAQAHRTIIRELDEKNLLQSHIRLVRQDSKRDTCRTLGNSRSKNSLHCDRRTLLAIAAALNKRTLRVERANAVNSHHKTVVVAPVFLRDSRKAKPFRLLRPCRIREIVNINHRRIAPVHIHRSLHQRPASLVKQLQAAISIHIDRSRSRSEVNLIISRSQQALSVGQLRDVDMLKKSVEIDIAQESGIVAESNFTTRLHIVNIHVGSVAKVHAHVVGKSDVPFRLLVSHEDIAFAIKHLDAVLALIIVRHTIVLDIRIILVTKVHKRATIHVDKITLELRCLIPRASALVAHKVKFVGEHEIVAIDLFGRETTRHAVKSDVVAIRHHRHGFGHMAMRRAIKKSVAYMTAAISVGDTISNIVLHLRNHEKHLAEASHRRARIVILSITIGSIETAVLPLEMPHSHADVALDERANLPTLKFDVKEIASIIANPHALDDATTRRIP